MLAKPFNSSGLLGVLFIVLSSFVIEQFIEHQSAEKEYKKIDLNLSLKQAALSDYFQALEAELESAASNKRMIEAMSGLSSTWSELNRNEQEALHELYQTHKSSLKVKQAYIHYQKVKDEEKYQKHQNVGSGNFMAYQYSMYDTAAHLRTTIRPELQHYLDFNAKVQEYGKAFIEHFTYYDLFLINKHGDVVYSYALEDDFGTNLRHGAYKNSNLGKLFKRVMKSKTTDFSEFEPYGPSRNAHSMFIAYPIQQNGLTVGVIALQITTAMIDRIVQTHSNTSSKANMSKNYLINHRNQTIENNDLVTNERFDAKFVKKLFATTKVNQKKHFQLFRSNHKGYLTSAMPFHKGNIEWMMVEQTSSSQLMKPIRLWWLSATLTMVLVYLLVIWLRAKDKDKMVKPVMTFE